MKIAHLPLNLPRSSGPNRRRRRKTSNWWSEARRRHLKSNLNKVTVLVLRLNGSLSIAA